MVIGSGVTGVEFTHMFSALGSQVTLIVSRQQVLPNKDPEVAAVLEDEFLRARREAAEGRARDRDRPRRRRRSSSRATTAALVEGSHALLCIGSIPNSDGLGCDVAGVDVDDDGYIPGNRHCQTNVPHIYSAGDVSGRLPLSSVAAMQGRKIAEHVMGLTARRAPPPRLRQGRVGDLHRSRDRRRRCRRGRGVRRGPQAARHEGAVLGERQGAHQGRPAWFVKILSDPATGVVLGGSIVGRNAAELISVVAVAVTNRLTVADIVDSLLVHPALAESLAEAAS